MDMMDCDVDSLVSVWDDFPPTPRSQVKYLSIEDVLTFQDEIFLCSKRQIREAEYVLSRNPVMYTIHAVRHGPAFLRFDAESEAL
jgi:hypothetical protein